MGDGTSRVVCLLCFAEGEWHASGGTGEGEIEDELWNDWFVFGTQVFFLFLFKEAGKGLWEQFFPDDEWSGVDCSWVNPDDDDVLGFRDSLNFFLGLIDVSRRMQKGWSDFFRNVITPIRLQTNVLDINLPLCKPRHRYFSEVVIMLAWSLYVDWIFFVWTNKALKEGFV